MNRIALRMDDVGASTKRWCVYSRVPGGNILFLKYVWPFKAWGPYRELSGGEVVWLVDLLEKYDAKMTVAVTACWVERDGSLKRFDEVFPDRCEAWRYGIRKGRVEIANHGLTHCIAGYHRPRWFGSNREYHREFWAWQGDHRGHIAKSQAALSEMFGETPVTFVPPGNVWLAMTEMAAFYWGIRYLSCTGEKAPTGKRSNGLLYVSTPEVDAFHDRDIVTKRVMRGLDWFEAKLQRHRDAGRQMVTVREIGEG